MRETAAGKWRASPAIVVKRLEFPHDGDIFLVIGFGVFLQVLVGHDGRAGAHNRPANRKKQQQQNRTTTTTEEEEEKGRASGGDSIGAASIGAGVGQKTSRAAVPRRRRGRTDSITLWFSQLVTDTDTDHRRTRREWALSDGTHGTRGGRQRAREQRRRWRWLVLCVTCDAFPGRHSDAADSRASNGQRRQRKTPRLRSWRH